MTISCHFKMLFQFFTVYYICFICVSPYFFTKQRFEGYLFLAAKNLQKTVPTVAKFENFQILGSPTVANHVRQPKCPSLPMTDPWDDCIFIPTWRVDFNGKCRWIYSMGLVYLPTWRVVFNGKCRWIYSMGLVYLPTWRVVFNGKCRWIYQSHGSYGLVEPKKNVFFLGFVIETAISSYLNTSICLRKHFVTKHFRYLKWRYSSHHL